MVKDSVAFKNVVSTGLVLDKNGQKMSKRLGNAADPFETLEKYGADATRWYMMTNANPWDNLKFDLDGIEEVKRKFFGTLYNTYSFFALYANIDGFGYKEDEIALEDRPEIDRWVISLLNSLCEEVKQDFADYEPTRAGRKVQHFVENNLSNWYVRLCRRRFWKGEYSSDKIAAYQTLYTCMKTVSQLMAPISPFFADWLYRNLNDASGKEQHISVHLSDFPKADAAVIDKELEERMSYAQRISSLVLSLRKKGNLRVRQPLQKIMLPILDAQFEQQVRKVEDLILAEVNVKEMEYITDSSGVIKKKIKPNFKTLGKKLGKDMKVAGGVIMALGQDDIANIEQSGNYKLVVGDSNYDLALDDFEISAEEIPGWQVAQDRQITVALDVTLTDELVAEGTARDLVKVIQNMRKESGLDVTDRILVRVESDEKIEKAIAGYKDYIANEVLADEVSVQAEVQGKAILVSENLEVGIELVKA
jgi:isoleucyl-tRNA synthetase